MLIALRNVLKNRNARIIFSIIWGLGLSAIFRKSCKGRNCIVLKAPPPKEVQNNVYKFNNKCYKYTPRNVNCTNTALPPEDFINLPPKIL